MPTPPTLKSERLPQIIEGALLAAGRPLSIDQILALFLDEEQPSRDEIRAAIEALQVDCANRGVELVEVNSGFRFQVKADLARWVANLWEERPIRYSRAVLETLALVAYRQPITRGEIEDVRGVAVSTNIVKSLLEREWVRILGYRDVPGKPALYGTTRQFLDYFNLKSLSDLPPLAEIRNIESIERELDFGLFDTKPPAAAPLRVDHEDDPQDEEGDESDETIVTAAVAVAVADEDAELPEEVVPEPIDSEQTDPEQIDPEQTDPEEVESLTEPADEERDNKTVAIP